MIRNLIVASLCFVSWSWISGAPTDPPALPISKEIRLRGAVIEAPDLLGYTPHHILGVAFSPDVRKLAVVAGSHRSGERNLAHLLVFDLDAIEKRPMQVDIRTNWNIFLYAFQWSEDNRLLFLQSSERVVLVDADNGKIICQSTSDEQGTGFTRSGGMIGNDRYIAPYYRRSSTAVWIHDSSCAPISTETFSGRIVAGAVSGPLLALSMERGGIVIRQEPGGREVVSIPDRRVQLSLGFAASGGMICSGAQPGPGDGSLYCWALGSSGASLRSQYKVSKGGTSPLATASRKSLVLIPDRSFSYNGFTEKRGYRLKRYVVWEGESGKVLAVIAPIKQRPGVIYDPPRDTLEDSMVFALSPDGKLAAVAAEDSVKIFKVPSR